MLHQPTNWRQELILLDSVSCFTCDLAGAMCRSCPSLSELSRHRQIFPFGCNSVRHARCCLSFRAVNNQALSCAYSSLFRPWISDSACCWKQDHCCSCHYSSKGCCRDRNVLSLLHR
ncbi:unnamed protein product [Ectocarpus sp. 13 AM-2016]